MLDKNLINDQFLMTNDQLKITSSQGFSLIELIIAIALLVVIFSAGIGSYFLYYRNALVNTEIDDILTLVKNTRFKSLKNANANDYGIYVDQATDSIVSYKTSYTPGNPDNIAIDLDKLNITNLSLQPVPGITNEILFEKKTGKTQNTGSFTLNGDGQNYIITINEQGVIDLTQ